MNKSGYYFVKLSVFLFFVSICLSGCWHIIQPEDLATISLLGFDKQKDNYVITAQILNPGGIPSGAAKGSTAEKPVRILVARGKTIPEALHQANRYNPGHYFVGHLGAIVIGEDIVRGGMENLIDALTRSTEFMETADIYIARGLTAEQLLKKTANLTPYPAEALRKTAVYSSLHTWIRPIRLNQVLQTISFNSGTLVIPGIQTGDSENPSSQKGDAFRLKGMAVLSDWKLKGWMDGKAALGYMWIMEQIRHHGFSVSYHGGMIGVESLPNRTQIKVHVQGKQIKEIVIQIKDIFRISELKNLKLDPRQGYEETKVEMTETVNKEVKKMAKASVSKAQLFKADVFTLGERVRMEYPTLWKQLSGKWDEKVFPDIPIRVEVDTTIRDTGETYQTLQ
ncbi:Ger(x)C family spore germination protein [Fodinisporobacter ferrooxydans]|uniref:Ger(X)C family spore germination protein n=1 Tax=Fodinisporobacter ferrooxydans TaxID=2901836 RepID=A0ABY4CP55_9BACL|nr:Ger(x)C family spore germination protein [Alicyclobacillaceae bacterium MYW30-H2]